MATGAQDLVGHEVYSRDGDKIGEIKQLVYGGNYAVVRRSLFSKLVVPLTAIDSEGDRLVLPFPASYLEKAPKVDPKYELSEKDKGYLDRFYQRRAA